MIFPEKYLKCVKVHFQEIYDRNETEKEIKKL